MLRTTSSARRAGLTAIAAIGCAAALVPSAASAAPSAGGNAQSKPAVSDAAWSAGRAAYGNDVTASEALAAYWTPERMRASTPVEESDFFKGAIAKHERKSAADQSEAKAKVARGERPAKEAKPVSILPAASQAPVEAAYNPNLSYWSTTARTNGKVFFTKGGVGYVCSGAIVNSEGADTVWTAGHCVHGGSGGAWHTNWTFVPAYDDDLANPRPYGTWSANQLHTRNAWINSSDYAEDIGVATMNTNLGGWHIVNYFGGHGFRVNQGKNVFENAMGYPAESPFDGGNLMRCWGTSSPEWTVFWVTSETIKVPCDLTRGSSGGPWLHGYDGNYGYLNGVNSRIDRIVGPTIMLSPYFDDTALSLYNYTRYM